MVAIRRACLTLALLVAAGRAGGAAEPTIEIVDWGLTSAREVGSEASPDTPTGVNRLVEEPVRVTRSSHIRACIGTSFGIIYRTVDAGEGTILPIRVVILHPLIRTPDGRAMEKSSWPDSAAPYRRYVGWVFEQNYELVAGKWTVSLRDQSGRELASKIFDISTGSCPVS